MPSRAKLTEEDLDTSLRIIHQKSPKAGQFAAIDTLFNEEKDVVFIARSRYRKRYGIAGKRHHPDDHTAARIRRGSEISP